MIHLKIATSYKKIKIKINFKIKMYFILIANTKIITKAQEVSQLYLKEVR